MAYISLQQNLRPLRIAFLIDPNDKKSLLEAIQINTYLWGGKYNILVPTVKSLRKDSPLNNPPFYDLSAKKIVNRYLNNYKPDYVVKIGKTSDYDKVVGDYQFLKGEDLLRDIVDMGYPKIGINIYDLLEDLNVSSSNNRLILSSLNQGIISAVKFSFY